MVLAAVLAAASAQAGILASSSNAISAFQGTRSFSGSLFFDQVTADVDYAAFAPGKFDDFLSEFSISFTHSVPSSSYVYAYQVHAVATTSPQAESFSVGLSFSQGVDGTAPSFIPLSAYGNGTGENGDEEPNALQFSGTPPTSALWEFRKEIVPNFFQGTLDQGEYSAILFFSASHGPKYDSAQVSAGLASGKSDFNDLANTGAPVPAPEPGSLILFALGGLGLLALDRRRRLTVS